MTNHERLALDYHKTIEGEYGCPGVTCPGVQRLVALLDQASAPAPSAVQELEALKDDIRACTPPSQRGYVFAAIFPLIHQRILNLSAHQEGK